MPLKMLHPSAKSAVQTVLLQDFISNCSPEQIANINHDAEVYEAAMIEASKRRLELMEAVRSYNYNRYK